MVHMRSFRERVWIKERRGAGSAMGSPISGCQAEKELAERLRRSSGETGGRRGGCDPGEAKRRGPFKKKDVAAMSHSRRDVGKPIRGPGDPLQEDLKAT